MLFFFFWLLLWVGSSWTSFFNFPSGGGSSRASWSLDWIVYFHGFACSSWSLEVKYLINMEGDNCETSCLCIITHCRTHSNPSSKNNGKMIQDMLDECNMTSSRMLFVLFYVGILLGRGRILYG